MKIRYLQSSKPGALWFKSYYSKNPQLNRKNAVASLQITTDMLQANPFLGSSFEDQENVREILIQATPFSLLYTIKRETIWIIDIRDQRGFRSADALRSYSIELMQKYNIK